MDCRQFLEHLSDYIDGDVSQGIKEAIEEHAAFCRKCEVMHNSTRQTLEIATDYGTDTYILPDSVSQKLFARLRSWFSERGAQTASGRALGTRIAPR
jgi:predicted anti-sigma-YlaC factor YlaD